MYFRGDLLWGVMLVVGVLHGTASTGLHGSTGNTLVGNTTNIPDDSAGSHRRHHAKKLIISTVLEEPYMMFRQNGLFLTGNDRFEGYLAELLQRLAVSINFQYEIRLSRDGKYGDVNDLDQWDGSIGEVLSGVADIAVGPLIVTEEKRQYVDFTESFLSLRSSALLRRPTNRGQHHRQQIITTGDQLLSSSEYTFGLLRNGVAQRSLSASTNPLHRAAWARTISAWPPGIVDSIQEGIERARRENFAFIIDSPTAEYVANRKPCDLYATEPFLDQIKYALAMRKDDRSKSVRIQIDRTLRNMRESSELQRLFLNWFKDECRTPSGGYGTSSSSSSAVKRSNSSRTGQSTGSSRLKGQISISGSSSWLRRGLIHSVITTLLFFVV